MFSLALKNKSRLIREASIYAIACYLQDNESGQISIIGHAITPPPVDTIGGLPRAPVAGSILVQTLVDAVQQLEQGTERYAQMLSQFWQSCRILENLCSYDLACKELLLRVPVKLPANGSVGDAGTVLFLPGGYLMRALSSSMSSTSKIHASVSLHFQVSILRFICILLNKSDAAVSSVLGSPSNLKAIFTLLDLKGGVGEDPQIRRGLGALILAVSLECTVSGKDEGGGAVSTTKGDEFDSDVMKLIRNGVGLERFSDLLAGLMQTNAIKSATSETYKRNSSGRSNSTGGKTEWEKSNLFDYSFRKFSKEIQESARRQLILAFTEPKTPKKAGKDSEKAKADIDALANVLEQYKEMIRVQDKEIEKLKQETHRMKKQIKKSESGTDENVDKQTNNTDIDENSNDTPSINLSDVQAHVTLSPGALPGEADRNSSDDSNTVATSSALTQTESSETGSNLTEVNIVTETTDVKVSTLLEECNAKDEIIKKLERTIRMTSADKLGNNNKPDQATYDDDLSFATMEILRLHSEIAKLELQGAKQEFKDSLKGEKALDGNNDDVVVEDYEMSYKKLYLEHRDLLVVLANQEVHNNAMTEKILSTLGEQAVEEVNQIAASALQNMLDEVTRQPINPLDKATGDRTVTSILAEAIHGKSERPNAESMQVQIGGPSRNKVV